MKNLKVLLMFVLHQKYIKSSIEGFKIKNNVESICYESN